MKQGINFKSKLKPHTYELFQFERHIDLRYLFLLS